MAKPERFLYFAILVGLLVCGRAFSQSAGPSTGIQGSFISGYVRDDDSQQPLKSVTVVLKRGGGEIAAPAVVTGTAGEFQFTGMTSGDYRIEVNVKGYEPASVAILLGGTPMNNAIVTLRREREGAFVDELAVSAHQLSVPDKAQDSFARGVKLLTAPKPDYSRAVLQFQHAIEAFPTYYEAYAEMGVAYYHLGQAADAEQALRQSMSLSSNQYAEAAILLSEMLDDANRFAEAEPVARQGIRLDALSWRGYLALARALSGMKHPAAAEVAATRASQINRRNPEIFLVLGNIHIQEHNWAGVLDDFDTFLALEPQGVRSDQVRKSREEARHALEKLQAHPARPAKN